MERRVGNCYTQTATSGDMKRRSFLRRAAGAPALSLAFVTLLTGCLGGGGSGDSGDDENGTADTNATEGGETPETTGVSLGETEFEVVGTGGGTQRDEVSVSFGESLPGFSQEDLQTVSVEGALTGRNSCYTAELESAEYDPAEDVFEVRIRSFEDREEDEVCSQVITEVEYRFIASFEGSLPGRTKVSHDGEAVAEAVYEA